MEITQQQSEEELQKLVQKLQEDHDRIQRIYQEKRKHLDEDMLISGKTIREWKAELWPIIPTDALNPRICLELLYKIMQCEGIASYEHARAEVRAQILDKESSSAYDHAIADIVETCKAEGKKCPTAVSLDNMANLASEHNKKISILSDNELRFWKNVLDHLSSCRKIIECAGAHLGIEAKAERSTAFFERGMNK